MKKSFLLLVSIISSFFSFSQSYYHYSRVQYTYGPYYFNQTMGLVKDAIAYKRMEKEKEQYNQMMKEKTKTIRDYYNSLSASFPKAVADGWHEVTIVSGETYIDNRKVHVKNNKVDQIVYDNWLPEGITSSGPIKDGKTMVQFEAGKGPFNGFVEVFFVNYIADPTTFAAEPLKPAKVTFWTNHSSDDRISINFDDHKYGFLTKQTDKEPECGDLTEMTIFVKPGLYSYKGEKQNGKNEIYAEAKISLKNGECVAVFVGSKKNRNKMIKNSGNTPK